MSTRIFSCSARIGSPRASESSTRIAERASWPGSCDDHGVDHAAQQTTAGERRQIVGDEDDPRLPARVGDRLGNAGRSRADVVDANQIRMIRQQPRHDGFADVILIPSLSGIERVEARIFQAHHLIETEDPLGVIAERLRPGDQPILPERGLTKRPIRVAAVRPAATLSMPT